jgi:hypothetical protein
MIERQYMYSSAMADLMFEYCVRDAVLKRIGFNSYAEYLKSDLWKSIRRQVIKQSPDCFRCGKNAEHVHHRSYSFDVMIGRKNNELVSTCSICHRNAEYDELGKKKTLSEANKFYDGESCRKDSATNKKKHAANKHVKQESDAEVPRKLISRAIYICQTAARMGRKIQIKDKFTVLRQPENDIDAKAYQMLIQSGILTKEGEAYRLTNRRCSGNMKAVIRGGRAILIAA